MSSSDCISTNQAEILWNPELSKQTIEVTAEESEQNTLSVVDLLGPHV